MNVEFFSMEYDVSIEMDEFNTIQKWEFVVNIEVLTNTSVQETNKKTGKSLLILESNSDGHLETQRSDSAD